MAAAPHVNWAARRIPSSSRPLLPGPTVSVVARAMDAGSFGLHTTAQNTARDRRHGLPRLADVLGQGVLMACCRSRAVTVEEMPGGTREFSRLWLGPVIVPSPCPPLNVRGRRRLPVPLIDHAKATSHSELLAVVGMRSHT